MDNPGTCSEKKKVKNCQLSRVQESRVHFFKSANIETCNRNIQSFLLSGKSARIRIPVKAPRSHLLGTADIKAFSSELLKLRQSFYYCHPLAEESFFYQSCIFSQMHFRENFPSMFFLFGFCKETSTIMDFFSKHSRHIKKTNIFI